MLSKAKFLKTTVLATLVSLAGGAAVTPASAHEYGGDRGGYNQNGYNQDGERNSGRGWDNRGRGDQGDQGWNRRGRDDSGWRDDRDGDNWGSSWRWRHRHHHHHDDYQGWY